MVLSLPEAVHHLVVGADSDGELARAESGVAAVTVLSSLTRSVRPPKDLAAALALARITRRGRYDVVVTHQSKAGVLVRAVASRRTPVVQSLSMASFGPGYPPVERFLFRCVERVLVRRSAAVCAAGADLASRFVALGVPSERVHVVRSGIPLPTALGERSALRQRLHDENEVPQDRPLVLYLGSLERRKNVALLPDLVAGLAAMTGLEPFLLVLGEGPERPVVCDRLRALRLQDDAALLGHVTDPDRVLDALRAADVLVLLSSAEGLPQVLVQAAAVGTPFVAFDVEGVAEMLRLGAVGEAVALGDLPAAVQAAARVLTSVDRHREPSAELSSWRPESVRQEYRSVLGAVLAHGGPPPAYLRVPGRP